MKQDDEPVVLVVDDTPINQQLMQAFLESDHYRVELASDGATALRMAKASPPDLILLDTMMPGMDGLEVCRRLKEDESTQSIPVIFITGHDDIETETRGFEAGGVDFITRPINRRVVLARVRSHLALYRQRRNLEGMFRDVMEFAPDAIILADTQGHIVRINARTEELFGYHRDELLGLPVETLIPQRMRPAHEAHRSAYAGQPRSMRMGVGANCLRKDGSEFPGDISLSPLQTTRGRLQMAVVRDATERKQQEEKLLEAARYARSLIETSVDPLILMDMLGQIQDANEAATRITGLSRGDLIGSDAVSKFTEPEKMYQGFRQIMEEGQALDYLLCIKHASGKLIDVHCSATAYRNEQGEIVGIIATARDVTERRKIREEISNSRQLLREMAAQNEIVREYERKNIAREVHDELGQVLTALRMDVAMLKLRFGAADPQLAEKVAGMKALVDRCIQGVRNVAGSLRPAALDMGLVPALEWLCSESATRIGIPFRLHLEQDDLDLDETRAVVVFRIVQESFTNIARYAQASAVDVTIARQGDELWVKVLDDGQGFDPAEAAQRKSFGLLGMRERALALGGHLDVRSAPGQGTAIRVVLPLDRRKENP
jgi:PAS domain S-box-containing protein